MVTVEPIKLHISDSIGEVSAELILPQKVEAIMTLAHGAGAGMHHPFMKTLATSLADEGIATLRFNFPFAEHKKKRPDFPAVAHRTIEAAIAHAQHSLPALPLFAAGKSFGGRMSSQHLAQQAQTLVRGIIFFGFPLHPAGNPSTERAAHLKDVKVPMLFLQGTCDELATCELIEPVCAGLKLATLVKLEGADHSLKQAKTIATLALATSEWIREKKAGEKCI